MKHTPLINILCAVLLMFYFPTAIQAGQVITAEEREWVKQAVAPNAPQVEVASSKSIVVLNFHNLSGQKRLDALQKGLAVLLINDLAKIESVTVVDRTRMQAMLAELRPGGDVVDNAGGRTIGKPLQAYYVVNGTISEGAIEQLEVSTSLIDVPFGNVTSLPKATGSINELYRLQKDVLFHIIDGLNIYLSSAQRRSLEVPASASTSALLAFFLGIDASDKGDYRAATDLYTRSLAEDPSLDLAREALKELQDNNLTMTVAESTPSPAENEPVPLPEKQEMSTGMKVGIGVAALAGGAALLAVAGGGGGGGGGSSEETPAAPTASPDSTNAGCIEGRILFTFSEPMDTRFGYPTSSDSSFDISGAWLDVQHYRVIWSGLDTYCESTPSSAEITLTNFQSEGGTALGGQTTFLVTFTD